MTGAELEAGKVRIPFGQKHKDEQLSMVLSADAQYVDWLADQAWVTEKYPEFSKQLQIFTKREDVQRKLEEVEW